LKCNSPNIPLLVSVAKKEGVSKVFFKQYELTIYKEPLGLLPLKSPVGDFKTPTLEEVWRGKNETVSN